MLSSFTFHKWPPWDHKYPQAERLSWLLEAAYHLICAQWTLYWRFIILRGDRRTDRMNNLDRSTDNVIWCRPLQTPSIVKWGSLGRLYVRLIWNSSWYATYIFQTKPRVVAEFTNNFTLLSVFSPSPKHYKCSIIPYFLRCVICAMNRESFVSNAFLLLTEEVADIQRNFLCKCAFSLGTIKELCLQITLQISLLPNNAVLTLDHMILIDKFAPDYHQFELD